MPVYMGKYDITCFPDGVHARAKFTHERRAQKCDERTSSSFTLQQHIRLTVPLEFECRLRACTLLAKFVSAKYNEIHIAVVNEPAVVLSAMNSW